MIAYLQIILFENGPKSLELTSNVLSSKIYIAQNKVCISHLSGFAIILLCSENETGNIK